MKYLLYIFVGFWALWILWYLTGGPLRDDKTKMFVTPTENGVEYTGSVKDLNQQGLDSINNFINKN